MKTKIKSILQILYVVKIRAVAGKGHDLLGSVDTLFIWKINIIYYLKVLHGLFGYIYM